MKRFLQLFASMLIFTLVVSIASIAQAKQSSRGFQPVTLCHATGSATNPFVTITVDNQGQLNGHIHHSGDIIPAPAGGCPGKSHPTPTPKVTPTPTPTPSSAAGGSSAKKNTPKVLGTVAPSAAPLPITGADVSYDWIYYLLIIGSLMVTYYLKVRGWKSLRA